MKVQPSVSTWSSAWPAEALNGAYTANKLGDFFFLPSIKHFGLCMILKDGLLLWKLVCCYTWQMRSHWGWTVQCAVLKTCAERRFVFFSAENSTDITGDPLEDTWHWNSTDLVSFLWGKNDLHGFSHLWLCSSFLLILNGICHLPYAVVWCLNHDSALYTLHWFTPSRVQTEGLWSDILEKRNHIPATRGEIKRKWKQTVVLCLSAQQWYIENRTAW